MGSFKHLHEADSGLITEALNTAPYELQMVKKGTDVQFLFKDDEFQVRFRNAPKLGSNVRRVTIRQKQGSTYKDVLKGLGSDTNKVLSTVIAAVEAYAKTPMGKSTDGLVVDFSKKAIGRGAKLIQAVLKRNKTIKRFFTAVDAAVATDAAVVSHWLVGKGKDAAEVFNGKDVVGLIGGSETPVSDPVSDPEKELKKAMDFLGATKLRHGYKGTINGLTFIMSKKTNTVDVFKDEDGVESGTMAQLPDTADSDLIIGAIEDASSAHKAKMNIASGDTMRAQYEAYIENDMGEDPVWKASDKRLEFEFEDADGDMLSVDITFSEDETEAELITVGWDGDVLYNKRNPQGDISEVISQALDVAFHAKETDEDLGDDSDREGLISAISDLEIDTGVSGWDDVDYAGFAMQATHIASGLVLTVFYTDSGEIGMNVKDPSTGEDVEDEVVDQDDVLDLMDDLGWDGEWADDEDEADDPTSTSMIDVDDLVNYLERFHEGDADYDQSDMVSVEIDNGMTLELSYDSMANLTGVVVLSNQGRQLHSTDNVSDYPSHSEFVDRLLAAAKQGFEDNKLTSSSGSFDYSQNGAYSIVGTVESVVHYLLRNTRQGGLLDRSDVTNFDGRLVDERGQTVANVFKSTNPERGYSFIEVRVGGNSTGELEIINGAVDISEIGEWFDANVQRILGESVKVEPSFANFLKEKQS